jgi:hypothetical protein
MTDPSDYGLGNPLLGSWTYRSFINDADISKDFNSLEFGRAELMIDFLGPGVFVGRLSFGDTYQFRLLGATILNGLMFVRFQGVGDTTDSLNQIYDYLGCVLPLWPNGVGQRAAIVGSVVRTVPHNGGRAKAGAVASFIALKR